MTILMRELSLQLSSFAFCQFTYHQNNYFFFLSAFFSIFFHFFSMTLSNKILHKNIFFFNQKNVKIQLIFQNLNSIQS